MYNVQCTMNHMGGSSYVNVGFCNRGQEEAAYATEPQRENKYPHTKSLNIF